MSMAKKYTQEQVIERFRGIHGDKYDYSEVIYRKMLEKVHIICRNHGTFSMRPNDHLYNHGCPACGGIEANRKRIEQEKSVIFFDGTTLFDKRYQKIHKIRKKKGNYVAAALKGKQTLRTKGKFEEWRKNWYQSMINNGHFHNPEKLTEYRSYKKKVYRESRKWIKSHGHLINYEYLSKTGHVIDHMLSVKDAFVHQIPINIVSHITNLKMLPVSVNARKGAKSSVSCTDLLSLIEDFNKFQTIGQDRDSVFVDIDI